MFTDSSQFLENPEYTHASPDRANTSSLSNLCIGAASSFLRTLLLFAIVGIPGQLSASHIGTSGGVNIPAWSKPIVAPVFLSWKPNNNYLCFRNGTAREAAYCHFYTEVSYLNLPNREGPPFYVGPASANGEIWAITDTDTGNPANPKWIYPVYTCPEGSRPGAWWSSTSWKYYSARNFAPYDHFPFCVVLDRSVDPDKNLGCQRKNGGMSGSVGNPCSAAIGNKYQVETDFTVPEKGSLSIVRYYNSLASEDTPITFMGKKWRLGLLTRLDHTATYTVESVRLQRPDGQIISFHKTTNTNSWVSDADIEESLEQQDGMWVLSSVDGSTERYDGDGKLMAHEDAAGLTTAYEYDQRDRILTITDEFGRYLRFFYDEEDYLTEIRTPGDETIRYEYGGERSTALNLVRVVYPDGSERKYHYENDDYPNHLTGITDENGDRFATYLYDTSGRAISTEHAVTTNSVPQEKHTLEFVE